MLTLVKVQRCVAATAVVALLACGAACGDTSATSTGDTLDVSALTANDIPADGASSADGLTIKDYQRGTLPTDPYRMTNPDLRNYAWDIYVATCMIGKGRTPSPVIVYDWNDPTASRTGGWSHKYSLEEASQYGYHIPPSDNSEEIRVASDFIAAQPKDWRSDYDACYQAAADDPLFQETVTDDLPMSQGEEKNPLLTEAAAKWRECMKPLGIPDLPEDAPAMAPSLATKFGLAGADNPTLIDLSSITAEEKAIATHDAQCEADSGYDVTKYGLVWVVRDRYVKAHMGDLTARRAAIVKEEDALKTYIEENRYSVRQG